MRKRLDILMTIMLAVPFGCAANGYQYDDGPYISIESNGLLEQSIHSGKVETKESTLSTKQTAFSNELSTFDNVEKIAAISDIHGQHDVFINILKRNHIIDQDLNWAFGEGHFVITGDIFDRGPQVLDSLWFIFELEKQAAEQGGKIHYLLGNHEYMVLRGDERYLHINHLKTSELLKTEYKKLFDENTVLGRWIRSKSTVIKINDSLFLHGGLSEVFLEQNLSLDATNEHFRQTIGLTRDALELNEIYSALHGGTGPIWYRGYFRDGGLSNAEVDSILDRFDAKRIVVGHTSQDQVLTINDGRVYAVDSSIKNGESGELLFISSEGFYRGTYQGEQIGLEARK